MRPVIDESLAPVVLFVYNRPISTELTLRALAANDLAKSSRLFIFSDGPKKDASPKVLEDISTVRSLIRSEKWCGEVNLIEREENNGLAASIIAGVNEIIDRYGRVIVLEDDLVTAPGFLTFMNEGLRKYEKERKIFGLTGFKAPSKRPKGYNTFFLPVMSSWSWATWKDRWETVSFDGPALLQEVLLRGPASQLDLNGYPFGEMLENQVAGKINSWAIRFYTSMYLQERWFMYPSWSLVRNIGFDGDATHTSYKHFLERVKIETDSLEVDDRPLEIDVRVFRSFRLGYGYLRGKVNGLLRLFGLYG
ncbi:glycosyltransferase [Neolewinella agarilytica]|uniref:glycosyltransferase n=1 Tax=Neolewinella agarilytica TaxID=478744 RepID=UPI002356D2C6|nr:glycosyltransferase [Neolewinella agarilytica]